MTEKPFDLIQHTIDGLLRAPNVRTVFVCDINGNVATRSGSESKLEQDILRAIASSVLPATKRMAEKSSNANEAQSISLPDDDLHLLVFWLVFDYFLLVSFSKPTNPYTPPNSIIEACHLIRLILQSPEQSNKQAISSAGIEMETAIYVERLVYSNKIIKDTSIQPNRYDLPYVEAQGKKVVEIAQDILSSKKGIIEGARLLTRLQSTVTRDDFDPDFLPFVAIVAETEDLPTGKECDFWASNALQEKGKEIQQAEELHRDEAFAACRVLIARFDKSS
jgi:hypothetical protein